MSRATSQGNTKRSERDLLTFTAVWPGSRFPRAGCFIRTLHERLTALGLSEEIVAPFLGAGGERDVTRFPNPLGRLKISTPSMAGGLLYLASAFFAASALLRRIRPRAVLLHWVLPLGPVALAACRKERVPLIVWTHGSDLEVYAARGKLFRVIAKRVLRHSAKVFAVSDSLQAKAKALGAGDLSVLSMGIDEVFTETPPRRPADRRSPGAAFQAVFIGDLIPAKGVDAILGAAGVLRDRRDIRLVFIGDGPLRTAVEQIDAVHHSCAEPEEIRRILDQSDLFLLPSRSEGAPLSLMEALARGVPVICSKAGGMPDFVRHGKQGILLDAPVRPRELARWIVRFADDGEFRARLRRGARRPERPINTVSQVAERFLTETKSVFLKAHV